MTGVVIGEEELKDWLITKTRDGVGPPETVWEFFHLRMIHDVLPWQALGSVAAAVWIFALVPGVTRRPVCVAAGSAGLMFLFGVCLPTLHVFEHEWTSEMYLLSLVLALAGASMKVWSRLLLPRERKRGATGGA